MASSRGGPQLLKDYLASSDSNSNSCSSTGFRSFPRRLLQQTTVRNLLEIDLTTNRSNPPRIKLTRSPSKAASALHRASQIFSRFLPFHSSVKSSRREYLRHHVRSRNVGRDASASGPGPFQVKDILRWKSFRDLVDDEEEEKEDSPPLDLYDDGTNTTTTRGSSSAATSWCDSDFTADELPYWRGNNSTNSNSCEYSLEEGKSFLPGVGGGDSDSTVGSKGDLSCEEKEQHSPVSVLKFPTQEDEQSVSPFHRSLENLERRKRMLLQDLEHFEHLSTKLEPTNVEDKLYKEEEYSGCKEYYGDHDEKGGNGIEEKATKMLNHIRRTSLLKTREASVDQLLLDFFSTELATTRKNQNDARLDILRVAEDWESGKYGESFDWEVEGKREAFVRDMERGERWRKFEEEREELAMEMEAWVLDYLVDELSVDLSCSLKTQKEKM